MTETYHIFKGGKVLTGATLVKEPSLHFKGTDADGRTHAIPASSLHKVTDHKDTLQNIAACEKCLNKEDNVAVLSLLEEYIKDAKAIGLDVVFTYTTTITTNEGEVFTYNRQASSRGEACRQAHSFHAKHETWDKVVSSETLFLG